MTDYLKVKIIYMLNLLERNKNVNNFRNLDNEDIFLFMFNIYSRITEFSDGFDVKKNRNELFKWIKLILSVMTTNTGFIFPCCICNNNRSSDSIA